jgi:hypothetical protein
MSEGNESGNFGDGNFAEYIARDALKKSGMVGGIATET